MKYAAESGSGAMIYVPSLMKIGSSIQKLIKGRFTDREHGDRVSLLSFFSK
jgi:hypothetical protein